MTDENETTTTEAAPLPIRERLIQNLEAAHKTEEKPAEAEAPAEEAPKAEEAKADEEPKEEDLKGLKRDLAKRSRKLKEREAQIAAREKAIESAEATLREDMKRDPYGTLRRLGIEPREAMIRDLQESSEDPKDKAIREAAEKAEAAAKKAEALEREAQEARAREAQAQIRGELRSAFEATSGDDYPFLHAFATPEQVAQAALEMVLEAWRTKREEIDPTEAFRIMEAELREHEAKLSAAKRPKAAAKTAEPPEQGRAVKAANPEPRKRANEDLTNRASRTRSSATTAHEPQTKNYFDKETVKAKLTAEVQRRLIP